MTTTSVPSWRQRVLALAEKRLPALTRLRRAEALPIRLHRRRIYVLPTRFGIAFAILLAIMLLGSLNYANNPALLLTCILAGGAWMSLFAGFRTLSGLALVDAGAAPCHAGGNLRLTCTFDPGGRARPSLRWHSHDVEQAFALPAGAPGAVTIDIPASARGWFRPGRIKLWSDQPLGLFVVWSWVHPDVTFLVYPALEPGVPAWPRTGGEDGSRLQVGSDGEFAGLRDYRVGDRPRLIAWKASARQDKLLSRESERRSGDVVTFDYAALAPLDAEARIRRLAAWVVEADAAALAYTLVLPEERLGPSEGTAHRHACLRALALLPHAPV
ncbi:DUF58 domain-containing protein [Dokdonella sp. MW10]|uniref:DUF58 domain-containing protein n=1 Tax=Dokdonella sp. MW10 TaxID=2992926 RepID=UPI003F7F9515